MPERAVIEAMESREEFLRKYFLIYSPIMLLCFLVILG